MRILLAASAERDGMELIAVVLHCASSTARFESAKALLDANPNPDRQDIRAAIAGNICRCTGYVKIEAAIEQAARELRKQGETS